MIISRILFALSMSLLISGCSSLALLGTLGKVPSNKDYDSYAKAQVEIAKTLAATETARLQALSEIAKSGSDASKVIATQAIEKNLPIKIDINPPK